ncbi:three-helix bundle dimerization domain-containing protein [Rhodococcus koreensis]
MTHEEELAHIDQAIDRLDRRFPDLSREEVERVVRSAHDRFADGTVRDFVPLLVERHAREKLQGRVPVVPVAPDPSALPVTQPFGGDAVARRRRWPGWMPAWSRGRYA